mmetsp:Transcript_42320/g.68189  ORF Transcript_42320/g.68189 Transcript_42320/m.68189 type:complete len:92 (+) Transcript_42320:141-416(+)
MPARTAMVSAPHESKHSATFLRTSDENTNNTACQYRHTMRMLLRFQRAAVVLQSRSLWTITLFCEELMMNKLDKIIVTIKDYSSFFSRTSE